MTFNEARKTFEEWATLVQQENPNIKFDFEWRLAYLDQATNIAWNAWLDGVKYGRSSVLA